MNSNLNLYFSCFYKPKQSISILVSKPDKLRTGLLFMAIPIIAYTLMYIFLTIGKGAPSVFKPWLNIPSEEYYAVNRFLLAPSMLICWLLASSVMQIFSLMAGGKGSYEQVLSALGLCISIAMWGGLIHDLPMSALSAAGIIDAGEHEIAMNSPGIFRNMLWIAYSIYLFAFIVLFTLSVRIIHRIKWSLSIIVALISFAVFQLMFLVFNR